MMEAGRELDALVAEKVLELKVDWEFDEPRAPALRDRYDDMGWLPHYSNDIAAAWQVAEKLRLIIFPWGAVGWAATDTEAGWHSPADTAPHAICLAALRAVGVTL